MKNYLQTIIKPKNMKELKDRIREFWLTLTPQVCQKYNVHGSLKNIEEQRGPSCY